MILQWKIATIFPLGQSRQASEPNSFTMRTEFVKPYRIKLHCSSTVVEIKEWCQKNEITKSNLFSYSFDEINTVWCRNNDNFKIGDSVVIAPIQFVQIKDGKTNVVKGFSMVHLTPLLIVLDRKKEGQ